MALKAKQINKAINWICGAATLYFAGITIAGIIKRKREQNPQGAQGVGATKHKTNEREYNIWRYILYPLFLNDEFIEWYYWEYKYDEDVARLIQTKEDLIATFSMIDGSNLSPYKKEWLKNSIEVDYNNPGERASWKAHLKNAEVFDVD